MKTGKDISARFKDLYIVHQNLPGKKTSTASFEEHILFLPLQGEISILTDTDKTTVGLGHMLYLAPNIRHSFSSSARQGERLIAMLSPKTLSTLAIPKEATKQAMKLPLNQFVKELLFYMLLHPETASGKHLVAVFAEVLAEALESSASSVQLASEHLESKSLDPRIQQSLQFLKTNHFKKVTMNEAASKAALSLRNFNRLFMEETGLQPKKWLTLYRIDKAKELLKIPGRTVTDVAIEVGYNSLGSFISAFRAQTGQLPSEFLKIG